MANKILLKDTSTLSENINPTSGYNFIGYNSSNLSEKIPNGDINAIGEINIGNSIFVSLNKGKTISGGAKRESLTNHFSNIVEAVSEAISGDTIYVYGGSHFVGTNILKQGVKYVFIGMPRLTNAFFQDLGVAMDISIEGNAIFRNTSGGYTFDLSGNGTKLNGTCFGMSAGLGGHFRLTNVSGNFTILDSVTKTNINARVCELNGNTTITINARFLSFTHIGSASNTTRFFYLSDTFTGNVTINSELITRTRGYGGIIYLGDNTSAGVITINSNFNLTNNVFPPNNFAALIWDRNTSGNTICNINGDVITNVPIIRYAGEFIDTRAGSVINFKGNVVSNSLASDRPCIKSINALKPVINFEGSIKEIGLARDIINIDSIGTDAEITLNGVKLYQNHDEVSLCSCINMRSTNKLILNDVKMVMVNSIGTPECITTDAATNIIVLHGQATSNVSPNVNISNSITGTNLLIDSDIN